MDTDRRDLALRLEEHEAAVWLDCVVAASQLPGDPLQAVIDRSGMLAVALVALCAVDVLYLNRVVALGVRSPVRQQDLDAIWAFYAANRQHNFEIEVTPDALPRELTQWLTDRGMQCRSPGTFKIWRPVEPPLVAPLDVEVRRLGAGDADAIAELNLVAWGAWNHPAMHSWFGATVGRAGWQHYGVFDADRLVSTGALRADDGLGWFGFDATHPRHQGRKLRQAISALRLADAAAQGCDIVHAESAIAPRPRVFRDGWHQLYEKHNYSTVDDANGVAAEVTERYTDLLARHRADVGDAMFAAVRALRWSADRLAAQRERRLRELLTWATERSSFHAERLAGIDVNAFTERDLPSLPVMTKADLMHDFDRVVTDPALTLDLVKAHTGRRDADDYLLDTYRTFSTSGTTGGQVLFVYGWDDWTTFVTMANRWRGRDGCRLPLDASIGSIFATSPKHISGALHQFSNGVSGEAPPALTHLSPTLPLSEIVSSLNAARPVVLQGYPSSLGVLALEAIAGRLRISPRRVLACGEQCTDTTRSAVAEAWGLEVHDYWGCSEGANAFPCGAGTGMHLPDDLVIVEPVDTHGNAVAPGRPATKILLTNLYNRTQPLIRYEITDAMTVATGMCECGCAHRRITDLAGRTETLFFYDGGAVVHSVGMESVILNDAAVTDFQAVQTPQGADIAVVTKGSGDIEGLRRRVVALMAGSGLADPQVTIRAVAVLDRLWSGKVRKFQPLDAVGSGRRAS